MSGGRLFRVRCLPVGRSGSGHGGAIASRQRAGEELVPPRDGGCDRIGSRSARMSPRSSGFAFRTVGAQEVVVGASTDENDAVLGDDLTHRARGSSAPAPPGGGWSRDPRPPRPSPWPQCAAGRGG